MDQLDRRSPRPSGPGRPPRPGATSSSTTSTRTARSVTPDATAGHGGPESGSQRSQAPLSGRARMVRRHDHQTTTRRVPPDAGRSSGRRWPACGGRRRRRRTRVASASTRTTPPTPRRRRTTATGAAAARRERAPRSRTPCSSTPSACGTTASTCPTPSSATDGGVMIQGGPEGEAPAARATRTFEAADEACQPIMEERHARGRDRAPRSRPRCRTSLVEVAQCMREQGLRHARPGGRRERPRDDAGRRSPRR